MNVNDYLLGVLNKIINGEMSKTTMCIRKMNKMKRKKEVII